MAILARHAPGVVACRALILAAAVLQVMMCGEQWNCLRDLGVERTASVGEGGTSPSPSPFPSTLLASQPAKGAAVSLGEGASPSSPSSLLGPQPRPSAVGGGGSSGGSMYPSGWLSAMSRLHTWEALCGRKDHASNDLRDGGRGKWTRAAVAAAAAARKRNVAAGGAAEVASSRRGSRGGGGSAHRLAWPRSERYCLTKGRVRELCCRSRVLVARKRFKTMPTTGNHTQ
ncbi:hypothetical protein T492DRAFT_837875 [Pavlovales sp. CCMP2436]|nr:hypothetical protein T492DRAFT_837875 [Pavlovales sp. CCMP2436]